MKRIFLVQIAVIISTALFSQVRVDGTTGYTTIGDLSPATETLEVKGNALFGTQGMLKLQQQSGQSAFVHAGSQPMYFRTTGASPATIVFSTDAQNRLAISKTGNIRFFNSGGQLARKSGDAFWDVVSDANLKTNVQDYTIGLEALMKIRPVTFNYNTKLVGDPNQSHVGIIAQEVEKVAPYMVKESEIMHPERVDESIGTYKSVNPNAFLFMLINGMQEQQKLIEEQKSLIDDLTSDVKGLKNEATLEKVSTSQVNLKGIGAAQLMQNRPNPFSNSTNIEYFIPKNASSAIVVFTDLNGNTIKTINLETGHGTIDVSVASLAKGVYTYTLIIDDIAIDSKKMIVE